LKTNAWFVVTLLCVSSAVVSYGQQTPAAPAGANAGAGILQEYDQAIDSVAEQAMRSVVEIEVTGFGKAEDATGADAENLKRQRSLGSGVIVDPSGYIVTNNHVVAGALRIHVVLAPTTVELVMGGTKLSNPQRVFEATLVGTSRYADLAVIKIDAKDLPYIPLPEVYRIRLGQTVVAIGAPEGLDHTVTKGIISAVGRQPEVDRPMVYVQTDAPINPGNSGGPLVDRGGNLVGINTFIYSSGGGSEGLGFAIPEPVVRFVYTELRTHGFVPSVTIGAHAQAITPSLAIGMKLPQDHGVIFSDIDADGPAAVAGLKPKDIVASIDGIPIDSLPKFTAYLYIHKRGTPMEIEVLRDGKPVTVAVRAINSLPMVDSLSDLINPRRDLLAPLGIFIIDINDFVASALPGLRSKHGVLVAGIMGEEPATLVKLDVGDVVRSMNGKPVHSCDEMRQMIAGFKPGDSVALEIERQSVLEYVAFEVE